MTRHQKGYSERVIRLEASSRGAKGRETVPSKKQNPSFELENVPLAFERRRIVQALVVPQECFSL